MPFNQYIKELSLIHKTMDTTAKRRYSLGNKSSFFKNCRRTSVKGRRNSIKPRKACYTFNSSVSEIGFSDIKMIKPCFVKLDKICDVELSKLLAKNIYGSKVGSNGKSQETPNLQSIEMIHNPTKNLEHKRNIDLNVNIDPKVLATEDHLDLLMAREMKSSNNTQMDKMIPRRVQCETTKSIKHFNLNPVVLLKKLSPQFISKAISGKLEMDSHEFTRRRKRKVLPLQRMAATNEVRRSKRSSNIKLGCGCCSKSSSKGLRRSERLSNISLSTENQNGYFHNRRNSCPSGRQYKVEGGKERLFGNKENIPRPRKRSNGKINNSDDEEEFYGFENNSKNNGRTAIVNRDVKCLMRDKVPFKAINRVEGKCSNNEDMSKKPTLEDYQSSICSNLLNARDKMMLHRNNVQYKDAGAEVMALNRLEILKLFKKKEAKLNICKMVRDQGKVIVSKTGELLNEDHLKEPLNFYSDKYYIKKTGRRKPLWAEESITNIIIEYQEEIPADIIAGYFGGNNGTDLTSVAAFLGLEFPEDDIKTR